MHTGCLPLARMMKRHKATQRKGYKPHTGFLLHRDWPRTGSPHKDCNPPHMDSRHRGCSQPHRGSRHRGLQRTGWRHTDYILPHKDSHRMDLHYTDCYPPPGALPGRDWQRRGYLRCGDSDQAQQHRLRPGRPHQTAVCFSRSFPETIHSKDRTQRNTDPAASKCQHKP